MKSAIKTCRYIGGYIGNYVVDTIVEMKTDLKKFGELINNVKTVNNDKPLLVCFTESLSIVTRNKINKIAKNILQVNTVNYDDYVSENDSGEDDDLKDEKKYKRIKTKRHEVQYYHNSIKYAIPIVITRGPKNRYIFKVLKAGDKEFVISTDIVKYLGPNHDFHGLNLTPRKLGYKEIIIEDSYSMRLHFKGDDVLRTIS